ncbi:MAG: NAD(P)/FAD-dependent oxidoreductase [Candidatus Omnitrophota bacterium]
MKNYDVAVIGAGPAGSMAAIRSAQLNKKTVLIEKNSFLGKKLLLTGKGRCNLTNISPIEDLVKKFGSQGHFLKRAFFEFSNRDLINFFETKGLKLITERQGRVFPATDKSSSVVALLSDELLNSGVDILYNTTLKDMKKDISSFMLNLDGKGSLAVGKIVLSTGGISYKETGSTGDGFRITRKLGHKITPLTPGLVPLRAKEPWVKKLQGLTLKNVTISYMDKKKIISSVGEVDFTFFGISGALALDMSRDIIFALSRQKEVDLTIDLKPALSFEQIERKLLNTFKGNNPSIKVLLKDMLPNRLTETFIKLSGVNPDKRTNQMTRVERLSIVKLFKLLPLTINGALSVDSAMVTAGGIATQDINPRTMESRIVPGLYFAGEIIDGCASSGGYNLQQAFSTGFLAGS